MNTRGSGTGHGSVLQEPSLHTIIIITRGRVEPGDTQSTNGGRMTIDACVHRCEHIDDMTMLDSLRLMPNILVMLMTSAMAHSPLLFSYRFVLLFCLNRHGMATHSF